MAARTDIEVNFELNPRLAEIAAGSLEISVQDSHDTLTDIQGSNEGHQYPDLVSTAGGESLGGGTTVGLTSTLDNVQYAFAPTDPRNSGTATTADALGITLTDNLATFEADGVQRGDWVINFTDQSVTEVISVTSETVLVTRGLKNGTNNQFNMSDAYKVWEVQEADLVGGNFVAIDDVDAELNPVFSSFGRFISKASASSATTANQAQLEYGTYNNRVTVDVLNGVPGTAFPIGTPASPVDNLTDAKAIVSEVGLPKRLHYLESASISGNVDNYELLGESQILTLITFSGSTVNTKLRDMCVIGTLSGKVEVLSCILDTVSGLQGIAIKCVLNAGKTMTMAGNLTMLSCYSAGINTSFPIVDWASGGYHLIIRDWNGPVIHANCDNGGSACIDMVSGVQILNNTVTSGGGMWAIRGVGKVVNNGTLAPDMTGVTYGQDSRETHEAHYNRRVHDSGANTISLYEDDKVTVKKVFDTNADLSDISPQ